MIIGYILFFIAGCMTWYATFTKDAPAAWIGTIWTVITFVALLLLYAYFQTPFYKRISSRPKGTANRISRIVIGSIVVLWILAIFSARGIFSIVRYSNLFPDVTVPTDVGVSIQAHFGSMVIAAYIFLACAFISDRYKKSQQPKTN